MLRSRLFRLWAPKYQRWTNAGMPVVTTMRADLPVSCFFHSRPGAALANANPGRKTCSKKAFSSAGMAPSHSG